MSQPVQHVERAGAIGGSANEPGSLPTATCASVRVSTGEPLRSNAENTSALSPGVPASVASVEVGTISFGRRYVVPGSNTTRASGNCARIPARAEDHRLPRELERELAVRGAVELRVRRLRRGHALGRIEEPQLEARPHHALHGGVDLSSVSSPCRTASTYF